MKIRIRDNEVEVSGYVNAVGRESRVLRDAQGYFTETISPGAFARALMRGKRQMLLNHDPERVLATEGENLSLAEDGVGLHAAAKVVDEEVAQAARNRELRGWSFGFRPLRQRFEDKEGVRHRIVDDLELFEVSLIDKRKMPAYAATSVFTRATDDGEGEIEYRSMDLQDVEVREDVPDEEPPDLTPYTDIIESLRR